MSNPVNSIQAGAVQQQSDQAVQPPKTLQTQAAKQTAAPQDQVTISQEARQALATNNKQAGG
jgi:hypothetical protein